MKDINKLGSIILLIPLFGIIFMFGYLQFIEGYNPVDPAIDTKFTADYTEEKFDQIKIGMDSTIVKSIIGIPYGTRKLKREESIWYFSSDGKCSWQDFAWLSREIKFDASGKVSEKIKNVYYD